MIREFQMSDFDRVIELNNKSPYSPAPKWFVLESIERGRTWVYVQDDKVVAFIIGKIKNDVPYINNIVVDEGHRGKGIATKLIKRFEESFGSEQKPENKSFWLQVDNDNPAQKLYFDLGYRVYWVDENYYGPGKHALCMHKSARSTMNMLTTSISDPR